MFSNSLFVTFTDAGKNEAQSKGFKTDFSYPVLDIDVVDDAQTRFLLANNASVFHWIDMSLLKRASQKPDHRTPDNGRRFAAQTR